MFSTELSTRGWWRDHPLPAPPGVNGPTGDGRAAADRREGQDDRG